MNLEDIFKLFNDIQPDTYEIKNLWDEETDFRQVIFPAWQGKRIVIKIACNGFTTPERFTGWLSAMEEYRKCGCYCPRVIKNRQGHFCETVSYQGKNCLIWAEEYSRYKTADQFDKKLIREGNLYKYHDDAVKLIGRIGSKHLDFTSWPSAWCIFQTFSPIDLSDETMGYAEEFKKVIEQELPQYLLRFRAIWNRYQENAEKLQAIYSQLPVSVFQGDLSPGNILLDEQGQFVGLIDFNLSGRETVLNYMLVEAMWDFKEDADRLIQEDFRFYDRALDRKYDESLVRNLKIFNRHYTSSEKEKKAAVLLYRYIRPFNGPVVEELKKARNDKEKAEMLLDWVEYQIVRDDLKLESILS